MCIVECGLDQQIHELAAKTSDFNPLYAYLRYDTRPQERRQVLSLISIFGEIFRNGEHTDGSRLCIILLVRIGEDKRSQTGLQSNTNTYYKQFEIG